MIKSEELHLRFDIMPMTSEEMISFFGEQAARASKDGMSAAKVKSNYFLATVNCRQAFKCRLMQGLISWRKGSDPTDFFAQAVQGCSDDWNTMISIDSITAKLSDTPAELVPFISYLIDQQTLPLSLNTDVLVADRLLDAVLGRWLYGSWDGSLWAQGITQLRRSRSILALETYNLYRAVVEATPSDMPELLSTGESLFNKRRSDKFYSGGDQTEGGGNDNSITVDYRLASLAKCAGYKGSGLHVWQW